MPTVVASRKKVCDPVAAAEAAALQAHADAVEALASELDALDATDEAHRTRHDAARHVKAAELARAMRTWASRRFGTVQAFAEAVAEADAGSSAYADRYRVAVYGRYTTDAFAACVRLFRALQ